MAAIGRGILRRGIVGLPVVGSGSAARSMASWFGHVEPAAKDPILGVTEAFLADPSPDKVNVGVVFSFSLLTQLRSFLCKARISGLMH